ncbi:MAG: PTS sugar transporter subunit IIA [Deltaproteobacteria bacterium]|nr:MAG: PTS sugar transporter subunit IIA [Deltaproteobacteria bacterium]
MSSAAEGGPVSFVARLRPELIHVAPPWRTFGETVHGLVESLVAAGTLDRGASEPAVRAVIAREQEASTALLDIGVGVPHARLVGLGQAVVALAVSRAGLYEPVPTVAVALRSADLRAALLAAPDARAALAALGTHARSLPSR